MLTFRTWSAIHELAQKADMAQSLLRGYNKGEEAP
jgi:hypothetical protein